jgi:hypothetical protein
MVMSRAVSAQRGPYPQQLGGASVAAAQAAVQRGEGCWLDDAVTEAHEIRDARPRDGRHRGTAR